MLVKSEELGGKLSFYGWEHRYEEKHSPNKIASFSLHFGKNFSPNIHDYTLIYIKGIVFWILATIKNNNEVKMSFRFKPKSDDDRILMNMFEQTIPDTVPELSKRYNCSKATIWGVFNKYRFVYKIEETTYYFYRVKRVAQLVYQDLKSYPHDIVAERSKRLGMCPSDIIAGLKYLKRNYPEMTIPKESITFIKNQFLAIKDDWIRYPFSTLHERSQRLGYKNFIIHRYLSFLNVNLKISHTKEMDIRNVMFHLETPPTHKQILNEFEIYPRELKVIFLKHKDRFNVPEKNYTAFRMRRLQEFINYWIREAPWVNLEELRNKVHLTQGIFNKMVEKAKEHLNVRTK